MTKKTMGDKEVVAMSQNDDFLQLLARFQQKNPQYYY